MNAKEIAKVIRRTRAISGRSQSQLARECGISRETISALESGKYIPRIKTLLNVCRVLQLEVVVKEARQ